MDNINLRNYAHLGDAVWELYIREKTVVTTNNSKLLHKLTTDKVNAHFQAELLSFISEDLTEEEHDLVRRARNLPVPIARRSNQAEYRQSTAFETLIGYWYKNNKNRLEDILKKLDEKIEF